MEGGAPSPPPSDPEARTAPGLRANAGYRRMGEPVEGLRHQKGRSKTRVPTGKLNRRGLEGAAAGCRTAENVFPRENRE